MKKLAILQAVIYHDDNINGGNITTLMGDEGQYSPGDDLYPSVHTGNTNVAFCGVMVVSIIVSVIAMCYCCHKGGRKRGNEVLPPQPCRWRYGSSTLPLHIYTVGGHQLQFCESEDLVLHDIGLMRSSTPSPPPEYETVIAMSEYKEEGQDIDSTLFPWNQQSLCGPPSCTQTDETGLPSYELAVSLGLPTARHL